MKPEEDIHCDGIHHRWSSNAPLVCRGCGHKFNDTSDLELRAAFLRKYGTDLHGIKREQMS